VSRRVRRVHSDAPKRRHGSNGAPGIDLSRATALNTATCSGPSFASKGMRFGDTRRAIHRPRNEMSTILINGNEYELQEGEKLNAIQTALRVGIEIPYYCWHPALSVVANCRMCEIETGTRDAKTGEIKMIPKLVPACQTPAKDGAVLVTDSEKVKTHQRMIM